MKTFLDGAQIRRLMRRHGVTIRGLAATMNITLRRIRHVRRHGVTGSHYVMDWMEGIAGDPYAEA